MKNKRMLVCGATGFIGRNIAETFASSKQYDVLAVYNKRLPYHYPGIKWIKADLTKSEEIEQIFKSGVDIIIQAAATTSGSKDIVNKPATHVTDNAVMNSLLMRAAYEHKINHFIFFSCTVMLQSNPKPQTESDFDPAAELHPKYFGVGWTKLYLERMCEFYSRIGNTKYTVIRHSNIYGPHDKFDLEKSHVFGATLTKVMQARNGKVVVWGSGEEARDLLYVEDLVRFVEKAIENQKELFGLYNCGYGEAITIKNLVQKIVEQSGRKLTIEHDLNQPTIKTSLSLDCSKAQRELGWVRGISLEEGIFKTFAWLESTQNTSGLESSESFKVLSQLNTN